MVDALCQTRFQNAKSPVPLKRPSALKLHRQSYARRPKAFTAKAQTFHHIGIGQAVAPDHIQLEGLQRKMRAIGLINQILAHH